MNASTRHWLHKLVAMFVGGGAASLTSSSITSQLDPERFNLQTGFWRLVILMVGSFLVSGLLNVMFYLRQFPIPPEEEGNGNNQNQNQSNEKVP